MSKQEAAMAILEYLTDHSDPKAPGTRAVSVTGDEQGGWAVEFRHLAGESRRGRGSDFAEALEAALRAPIL